MEAAELGHGYLTFALIEDGLKKGLADKDPKDGQSLAREWFNYAEERVPQMQEREMQTRLLLYRRLESLQEYLLVAQDKVRIEHYVRQGAHGYSQRLVRLMRRCILPRLTVTWC